MDGSTPATETVEKAKRAEGIVKTAFVVAGSDELHKRVPKGVVAVDVNGKRYDIAAIPAEAQTMLVAFALASRAKAFANNHADEAKKGEDVHELVDQVYADLLKGELYGLTSSGGSEKKEKKFDASMYVEAVLNGSKLLNQKNPAKPVASQDVLDAIRNKIENELSGKERTGFLIKLRQDPYIGPAYAVLKAKADLAAANSKSDAEKAEKVSTLDTILA